MFKIYYKISIYEKQLQVQSYELGKKSLETKAADSVTDLIVEEPIIIDNSKEVIKVVNNK